MPGYYTFYSGAELLKPVAVWLGFEVDKVNFVFCQFLSLPAAVLFYRYRSSKEEIKRLRLLLSALLGLYFCFFCYGGATKHLIADALLNFMLMKVCDAKHVHKAVFCCSMAYMSYMHMFRAFFSQSYLLDITGSMMIMTEKLTSLAFNLHDGSEATANLDKEQQRLAIKEAPSWLQYFSFLFNFQSVLCGPFAFYKDHVNYVQGVNLQDICKEASDPQPWEAVRWKLKAAFFFLVLNATLVPRFAIEDALSPDMGFFHRFAYIMFCLFLIRTRYYYAWMMADAIANASGFGWWFKHETGKTTRELRWDYLSNVHVFKFETADNWKECLEAWNCNTMQWLRQITYLRLPTRYRTVGTYAVSAWWHGFYPGYYVTFFTGALVTLASRNGRRYLRHFFLGNSSLKQLYDVITFVLVRIAISYTTVFFVLLYWEPSFQMLKNMYFFLHIAVIPFLVVPLFLSSKRKLQ